MREPNEKLEIFYSMALGRVARYKIDELYT
jgi:hypothetical protein